MSHIFERISGTLILSLVLSFSFGQNHVTINLRLIHGTDRLIISDMVYVDPGDTLSWRPKPGENVDMLKIHGKRAHPFKVLPVGGFGSIDVVVRPDAPPGWWKYTIEYRLKNNQNWLALDPKIAVNPIRSIFSLPLAFGFIVMLITSIFFGIRLSIANKELRKFRSKTF